MPKQQSELVTRSEHRLDMVIAGLLLFAVGFLAGVIYMGVVR